MRAWLRDNIPTDERPQDFAGARAWDMAWQRRQFDGGYGGIAWPRDYGGQGLPLVRQLIWFEEYAKARGPGHRLRFRRHESWRPDPHRPGQRGTKTAASS